MTLTPAPIVALSGGVGGAKLAHGLAQLLAPDELLIVANTGDDFDHLGLRICPDIDSILYALAGQSDRARGWGVAGETWHFMDALAALGGPNWFRLGDRDLAMHVLRTQALAAGTPLTEVTQRLAMALGVQHRIVPMTEARVRTRLDTSEGWLDFQEYFVARACQPTVRGLEFDGATASQPSPQFAQAMRAGGARAVIVCPSNPYLSIDPILSVPGVREWLARRDLPVVAVSPIVGGESLKGPAARLLRDLAGDSSALTVARHYADLIDTFVIDRRDADARSALESLGVRVVITNTVMTNDAERAALASELLADVAASREAQCRRRAS
jgi:LPPG:FO 2-phospho-L-lactate transferase